MPNPDRQVWNISIGANHLTIFRRGLTSSGADSLGASKGNVVTGNITEVGELRTASAIAEAPAMRLSVSM
jgi:hypothetical protein